MVLEFANSDLGNLFQGRAVSRKPTYSSQVVEKFKKTVLKLQFASNFKELSFHSGLNFKALRGNCQGYHSVRVDIGYRLILKLKKVGGIDVIVIHELNNHYE